MKNSYLLTILTCELLLTAKITPDVNLLLVHAVQELRSSLHGRRRFLVSDYGLN